MALSPPLDTAPDEVRAALAPLRNNFSVALYACQNAFAVGAIIRVAHSFLVHEVILIGSEPYYAKASMGMEKYETIVRVDHEAAFWDYVRGRPVWAIEKDAARESLYAVDHYPADVVLLFGSERAGLPPSIVTRCSNAVGIPMYGVNHSFPVAIAAGIVMNDWARRHYTAVGTTLHRD